MAMNCIGCLRELGFHLLCQALKALNKATCSNAADVSTLIDCSCGGSFRKQDLEEEPSDGKVSQEYIWSLIAFSYSLIWQVEVEVEVAPEPVEMAQCHIKSLMRSGAFHQVVLPGNW
jgi:hypothetical protein